MLIYPGKRHCLSGKSAFTDNSGKAFLSQPTNMSYIYIYIYIYTCTTWTLTKRIEKKFYGNCTRMLRANPGSNIQQRHLGHCWRYRDELVSDVLLWILSHGRISVGRLARTYLSHLCGDIGCSLGYLPKAMDDRNELRERVREIPASGTIR